MARKPNGQKGFLARLLSNQAGNVLFMTAAFLIPLLGLVGGGVDMSRLYLAKTRLQQACDAGALAGRKAMGTGNWTTGTATTTTEGRALNMFAANFKDGDFGTGTVTKNFTQSGGSVTGTASVTMPMMVIKVLGIDSKTINVSCTANMEIPNTDVMFVLDVTLSMSLCPDGSSGCTGSSSRIGGLKSAVKCFYEALMKVNTTQNCTSASSPTDPTATSYTGTPQIRFGFVPYSVNVNVGKLLPHSFIADSWDYQTRVATPQTVYGWTVGTESAISWGSWSPSIPNSYRQSSNYNSFSPLGKTGSTMVGGVSKPHQQTGANSSNCAGSTYNTYPGNQLAGVNESFGSITPGSSTSSAPVHPAATQSLTYSSGSRAVTVTGYRYRWFTQGGTNGCWLESASAKNTYSQTASGTSTKPVTWTTYSDTTWTYKQATLNVSGLKNADGTSWNSSVSLPLALANSGTSAKLSGSNTSTNLKVMSNTDVTWDGCIEERATVKNSDYDPTDEWNPIPTAALDMDINTVPSSTPGTKWGPLLRYAVWGRYDAGGDTQGDVITSSDLSRNFSYSCPVEARTLQTWYNPSATNGFEAYVNSLTPTGSTWHDIGLIWGARLLSPTGIFASQNNNISPIQRHIVFMTDGDTNACKDDYSSQGIGWWDRRQTTYAPSDVYVSPYIPCGDSGHLSSILNSRVTALCSAIKNMTPKVTLWVVAYGTSVSTATQSRLQNCASSPNAPGVANTHYFLASNTTSLLDSFRNIASQIGSLRLTQ